MRGTERWMCVGCVVKKRCFERKSSLWKSKYIDCSVHNVFIIMYVESDKST